MAPLEPQEKGFALADWHLKSCAACGIGCGVRGFATNLLLFVADINRALLRGARVTVVRRRTACGGGIAALAALMGAPVDGD